MKRESILFTLTVTFLISLSLVVISFLILLGHNFQSQQHHIKKKYSPIARMVLREHFKHNAITKGFEKELNEMGFEYSNERNKIRALTYNPKTKVVFERQYRDKLIRVLALKQSYYLYIKQDQNRFEVLLEDTQEQRQNTTMYIVALFTLMVTGLLFAYFTTFRKLYPLKILKEKVTTLADENFDFECCDTSKNDEVSALAREFKNTAKRLKEIKDARNVFIRNVMHELKTPITKGKFLTQLPHSEDNDEKMKNVFSRLEALINEFTSIEELISSAKHFEKSFFYLNDIVDNAVDTLMLEENKVTTEFENLKLHVNYKLFTLAVKNLIDNAIKYSNNQHVVIKTENEGIIFENEGSPLKYELEQYYEPFFANEQKNKESFGLGLYIVNSILKASEYKLEYEYKEGINRFKIQKEERN